MPSAELLKQKEQFVKELSEKLKNSAAGVLVDYKGITVADDTFSDAEALAPARDCYESGMPGMEEQFAKYMDAVSTLEQCGIPREQLMAEKAELYRQLADVNREIRQARKEIAMCETIEKNRPQMEHDIQVAERRGRQQEMELPSR